MGSVKKIKVITGQTVRTWLPDKIDDVLVKGKKRKK